MCAFYAGCCALRDHHFFFRCIDWSFFIIEPDFFSIGCPFFKKAPPIFWIVQKKNLPPDNFLQFFYLCIFFALKHVKKFFFCSLRSHFLFHYNKSSFFPYISLDKKKWLDARNWLIYKILYIEHYLHGYYTWEWDNEYIILEERIGYGNWRGVDLEVHLSRGSTWVRIYESSMYESGCEQPATCCSKQPLENQEATYCSKQLVGSKQLKAAILEMSCVWRCARINRWCRAESREFRMLVASGECMYSGECMHSGECWAEGGCRASRECWAEGTCGSELLAVVDFQNDLLEVSSGRRMMSIKRILSRWILR